VDGQIIDGARFSTNLAPFMNGATLASRLV
jgi:hypothetical protein